MISIIIPTCNRNDLLGKCLECLSPLNQQFDKDIYEIIVTDDSKENIAKGLIDKSFTWVKWVAGPKKGPAANRNNGAISASGEWLLFIDDDCLPDKNILQEYTKSIKRNKDILVFEGSIRPDRIQQSFDEECPINETGGYLWSCNFMIEKKLFLDIIKGFDENFPYAAMEDVDMHYRLKKTGSKIVFLARAFVIHPWRKRKKVFTTELNRFKSTLYFLDKHPEKTSEINSLFFFRMFYNTLIKYGILKATKYKLAGFSSMLIQSFTKIIFSIYLLFRIKKNTI